MNLIPSRLRYVQTHEWVCPDADGTFVVGITHHAQEALGDIVFLKLPAAGREVSAGETCATIESVKAASDIHAPVTGSIVAVNQAATDAPESINEDAYAVWLFRIRPQDASSLDRLLDATAYAAAIG